MTEFIQAFSENHALFAEVLNHTESKINFLEHLYTVFVLICVYLFIAGTNLSEKIKTRFLTQEENFLLLVANCKLFDAATE